MPTGIPDDREADRDAVAKRKACMKWCNSTAFQRDCLITIQWFEANGQAPKGVEILDVIGSERGESINHGRLYPNLDALADADLVKKGSKDKRTNEYTLTDRGRKALRAGSERFTTIGGDDE